MEKERAAQNMAAFEQTFYKVIGEHMIYLTVTAAELPEGVIKTNDPVALMIKQYFESAAQFTLDGLQSGRPTN